MPIPKHSHTTEAQGGTLDGQNSIRGIADLSGFGDGSDGDVTVSAPTDLTRTMFYNTLIVESSGDVDAMGYEIYARVSVVVESGGAIHSDGADGSGRAVSNSGTSGWFVSGDERLPRGNTARPH